MKRNLAAVAALVAVMVVLALCVVWRGTDAGSGSALSRAGTGWAAARFYLERRGTSVRLLDRPLDGGAGAGRVLVLVFPWQRWELSSLRPALARHLQAGGDVVFAYSGERAQPTGEAQASDALGLHASELRPPPPLSPLAWRAYSNAEWDLQGDDPALAVRVRAFSNGFEMPSGGTPLLRDPQDRPLAFVFPHLRGRVVVLPAALLANGSVGAPGAANLLETLRAALPGPWAFDEYHHGLQAATAPAAAGSRRVFDLWLLHLGAVYLLAVLALARPFGPVWSDPPVRAGSAASFLRGLGALHRRLGHQRAAARALVERARELDPRLAERAMPAEPSDDLLAMAQAVAGAQRHARRNG